MIPKYYHLKHMLLLINFIIPILMLLIKYGKSQTSFPLRDGTEEVTEGGNLYYWPAGHTAVVEEDVEFLEFSPKNEMKKVLQHVKQKLQAADQ